jgi:uncharacterized membrane protein
MTAAVSATTKKYSEFITSYDMVKGLALLLMVVDHVGYYFFPDILWWRAVGRLSAPLWLFLIGFARSRDIPPRLLLSAAALVVASFVFGGAVLPVNILIPIMLIRLTIDPIAGWILRDNEKMLFGVMVMLFLLLPTYFLFDYGSLGFMIALYGYMMRAHLEQGLVKKEPLLFFALVTGGIYSFIAVFFFKFNIPQQVVVICGVVGLSWMLSCFRPAAYPALTQSLPAPLVSLVQLCGRRTLEFYVLHVLAFKAIACFYHIGDHGFLQWKWI